MSPAPLLAADISSQPSEEETMPGHAISTACGRSVLVRTCVGGEGVQLGIVGKRGGLIEAVSFDPAQLPSLLASLELAGEKAHSEFAGLAEARGGDLLDRLAAAEAAANATHCPKGHELTPQNSFQKRPGIKGCRECRRETNVWTREGGQLRPMKRGLR